MKLLEVLKDGFLLMVSLPRNCPELARAAVEAGAGCIKVHLNCHHFASDTRFGSWSEEKAVLQEILAAVDVPVGVVTGESVQPGPDEMAALAGAGFDFWDLFAKFAPPDYLRLPRLGSMVAIDSSWTPSLVKQLGRLGVGVIESSIIPRSEYRSPLNLIDLCAYANLAEASPMPILIPTQKAVLPHQVQDLARIGAAGITIGAVVTGLEADGLKAATSAFRRAIDAIA
ncbi:MAG: hypothetical protein AB7S38_04175 [Vulcanimicrobiota bacterium]